MSIPIQNRKLFPMRKMDFKTDVDSPLGRKSTARFFPLFLIAGGGGGGRVRHLKIFYPQSLNAIHRLHCTSWHFVMLEVIARKKLAIFCFVRFYVQLNNEIIFDMNFHVFRTSRPFCGCKISFVSERNSLKDIT